MSLLFKRKYSGLPVRLKMDLPKKEISVFCVMIAVKVVFFIENSRIILTLKP